jgi:hypothetical protein
MSNPVIASAKDANLPSYRQIPPLSGGDSGHIDIGMSEVSFVEFSVLQRFTACSRASQTLFSRNAEDV